MVFQDRPRILIKSPESHFVSFGASRKAASGPTLPRFVRRSSALIASMIFLRLKATATSVSCITGVILPAMKLSSDEQAMLIRLQDALKPPANMSLTEITWL